MFIIYIYIYIYIYIERERERERWFGLVWGFCFNGISTLVGYLMPNLFSLKNSSGTI